MSNCEDSIARLSDTGELLSDRRLTVTECDGDKKQVCKWTLRKNQSKAIAKAYRKIGHENRANNIQSCGDYLKFQECSHGHYRKLAFASFCKQRLCPMCQWRRSLKTFNQVYQVMEQHKKGRETDVPVMLTLTVPNISSESLNHTVSEMSKAWNNILRHYSFFKHVTGWFRSLEVTYNRYRKDFHPHYHVLLMVKKTEYYQYCNLKKVDGKPTIQATQESIGAEWGRLLGSSTPYIAHLQKLTSNDAKMIAEVAKYATKPSSYILYNEMYGYFVEPDVIEGLHNGLTRKRLCAFGGMFKTIKKELHLEDVESESADLVNTDKDNHVLNCPTCKAKLVEHLYKWRMGFYVG